MRALVRRNNELVWDENYPAPKINAGEVVVKTILAGVCDTDIQLAAGYLSFTGVFGHEFVGVVAEGPDGWRGKRVVGEINCACGNCEYCRRGLRHHCPNRTVLGISGRDGTFAEFFTLPLANLHEIPATLTDERALFTEPLAAAVNVVERNHIRPDAKAAILGDGKLGLLVAGVLAASGADVVVVGHHARRADRLAELCGREIPILHPGETAVAVYDVVVECTGAADGLSQALRLVRPQGTVVLKSTTADPYNVDLAPAVVNEVVIAGNRCGPFAPALRLLTAGAINPLPLIEAEHEPEELPAILAQGAPGLKHVIRF